MNEFSSTETTAPAPAPAQKPATFRRWFASGILGLTLGAVLLGGTAFAQTGTDDTGLGQSFLDRLAGKLGITSDELESVVKETQVEVIDDAVADGRLTEAQGEALKERIESSDGTVSLWPGRHALGMRAFRMLDINLATIASELGITTDELRAELEAGATLSEVISTHGSTVDAVVTALVADAETELAEAVASGHLTQDQADQILANLPDRLTRMIESGLPGACERWFNDGTDDADDADETSSEV